MIKKWKLVRIMLGNVGYTTIDSARNINITDIDSDGYIYYTDENNDNVKALYDSTEPIIVNPSLDTISFTSHVNYLAGTSGYTTTLQVKNDNLIDVTNKTHFVSSNTRIVSVNGAVLTAVASGTCNITATHDTTATATTSITVGPFVDTLSHDPSTESIPSDGTYNAVNWVNSLGQIIPVSQLTLTLSENPFGTIDANGLFTANGVGTTTITATDKVKTRVSGTLVISTNS
jgi:hypothetical protein